MKQCIYKQFENNSKTPFSCLYIVFRFSQHAQIISNNKTYSNKLVESIIYKIECKNKINRKCIICTQIHVWIISFFFAPFQTFCFVYSVFVFVPQSQSQYNMPRDAILFDHHWHVKNIGYCMMEEWRKVL